METTSEHPHKLVQELINKVFKVAEIQIVTTLAKDVGIKVDGEIERSLTNETVALAEKIISRMRWNDDGV